MHACLYVCLPRIARASDTVSSGILLCMHVCMYACMYVYLPRIARASDSVSTDILHMHTFMYVYIGVCMSSTAGKRSIWQLLWCIPPWLAWFCCDIYIYIYIYIYRHDWHDLRSIEVFEFGARQSRHWSSWCIVIWWQGSVKKHIERVLELIRCYMVAGICQETYWTRTRTDPLLYGGRDLSRNFLSVLVASSFAGLHSLEIL